MSSFERIAVRIKSTENGSQDYSKSNLDVQKCYFSVARQIAVMTTDQINSNSVVKV